MDNLQMDNLQKENQLLKDELKFYKSLFKTNSNSVVFNLHIKTMNGKKVWVDPVRDSYQNLSKLDKDEDVNDWLAPVKPSR